MKILTQVLHTQTHKLLLHQILNYNLYYISLLTWTLIPSREKDKDRHQSHMDCVRK